MRVTCLRVERVPITLFFSFVCVVASLCSGWRSAVRQSPTRPISEQVCRNDLRNSLLWSLKRRSLCIFLADPVFDETNDLLSRPSTSDSAKRDTRNSSGEQARLRSEIREEPGPPEPRLLPLGERRSHVRTPYQGICNSIGEKEPAGGVVTDRLDRFDMYKTRTDSSCRNPLDVRRRAEVGVRNAVVQASVETGVPQVAMNVLGKLGRGSRPGRNDDLAVGGVISLREAVRLEYLR